MFQIGTIGSLGGTGGAGGSGTPPPVITPTAISLSATSITLPATNANSFVATITITATGGSYTGPVSIGGADAAKFALSHSGFYPCNLVVGSSNIATSGTYNITLTASPITTPFAIAVTIAITPTAISLSTTSISLPPANANALVATITVTATGGTYAGPVTLGGADAAKFVLSNGGVYPCNLLVGSTSIANATYNITLTATPITTPFAIAVSVITPTAINLSATSINFANFVNAGAFVATITVTATGGAYTGPVTLSGTNAALFALSNGGISPCNLLIGAANVPTGSYSISLTAAPVTTPFSIAVTVTVPGFVPQADGVSADIYMDFVNGNYFGASPATWSFSRASPEWADNQVGVWSQFASGVPAITNKGLVVNPAGTNLALQCRDLAQAAWVKTNMTAVLTQVGIDGGANSATLLTATAANATVLQAITNASATTIASFFLKRVTGTGVVNITLNGGTTWTAVTLTASFARFFINTAAVVNPSIGIQIVTSGDVVVADFAQCEVALATLGVPSTPILTTTAQVTRAADSAVINVHFGSAVTLLGIGTPIGGQIGGPTLMAPTDGTTANRITLGRATLVARVSPVIGGTITNMNGAAWADVPGKLAVSGTSGAFALSFNGGTVVTATPTGFPTGMININLGSGSSANPSLSYWYITSIAVWLNYQASNAALQALTTASAATVFPGQSGNPVGFAAAPGFTSLTAWPGGTGNQTISDGTHATSGAGTSGNPWVFQFYDFDAVAGGTLISVSHAKFIGCRFQSNQVGFYNLQISGGDVTLSYCTIAPRATLHTAPPNAAWPAASAGLQKTGDGTGYQISGNDGYQYGVFLDNATANITIDHCDIWGFGNAVTWQAATFTTLVSNCWIHDAADAAAQSYHTDGPGYLNGAAGPSNITISGCTIASIGNTNGFAFQAATSGYNNMIITGNYLSGFGYNTALSTNAGQLFTNSVFSNNTFGTDLPWVFGPLYANFTAMMSAGGNAGGWRGNKLKVLAGTSPVSGSVFSFTSADDGKFVWPDSTLHITDFTG